MDDCKSFRSYQMLGGTADGVFLYVEAVTTTQTMPYGRLKIVQKLSDARQHFRRRIFHTSRK